MCVLMILTPPSLKKQQQKQWKHQQNNKQSMFDVSNNSLCKDPWEHHFFQVLLQIVPETQQIITIY